MRTSLIINTACKDPNVMGQRNPHRSLLYADRARILSEILGKVVGKFDEIIVAGVFGPAEGDPYTYLFVPPQYGDRRDALYQRELGARHSTGDTLIFSHDDHEPDFNTKSILDVDSEWDILVPKRIHGHTKEELNNGGPRFEEEPYMGGHTLVMKRHVWAAVPWLTVVPHRNWDIPMTRIWKEHDFQIAYTDDLLSIDREAQPNEV